MRDSLLGRAALHSACLVRIVELGGRTRRDTEPFVELAQPRGPRERSQPVTEALDREATIETRAEPGRVGVTQRMSVLAGVAIVLITCHYASYTAPLEPKSTP